MHKKLIIKPIVKRLGVNTECREILITLGGEGNNLKFQILPRIFCPIETYNG